MSCNVMIILEDFTNDQYMAKPVIENIMADLEKANAKVRICLNPKFNGVSETTDFKKLKKVLDLYPMYDIFILLIDRDGQVGRTDTLNMLEELCNSYLRNELNSNATFVAEHAIEELEVWILAGHQLPNDWSWKKIREEINPKEVYYYPFAEQQGQLIGKDNGRKQLMFEACKCWQE